jgi:enamine deaminase RidA (YjgF/YER057c/UK114 family)
MSITQHNPAELFPRYTNYSHAVEVRGDSRLLFVSGLNGYLPDGKTMPLTFDEQAEIVWGHLKAILGSAGMTVQNLVSLRFYLADPKFDEANVRMRARRAHRRLLPAARSEVEARGGSRRRDLRRVHGTCHVSRGHAQAAGLA